MKKQKIYLIRHGETDWTLSKRHTGQKSDIALTERGKKEAVVVGKKIQDIKFSYVFSSSLQRAKETCKLAGFGHQMHIEDALLEWDYGDYEGLTSQQIHQKDPEWTVFSKDSPHGESVKDVQSRVDALLKRLIDLEGNIALFSSGHISRAIGARWIGMDVSFGARLLLSTASISILGYEHGIRALEVWNRLNPLEEETL